MLSSRISYEKYGPEGAPPSVVDDDVGFVPTPEPTPEPTPSPVVTRDPELPDVSIYSWELQLANNTNVLSSSFTPGVANVGDGSYTDWRCADALLEMINAAIEEGYSIYVAQGYRSYSTQATLFYGRASIISESQGIEYADAEMMARKIVAYPGTSDHQTGLGVDLKDDKETLLVADEVRDLPLYKWLDEHCAEYGFIKRYPQDKKDITGWDEPWHYRYVGKESAKYIMDHGICLEEYINIF